MSTGIRNQFPFYGKWNENLKWPQNRRELKTQRDAGERGEDSALEKNKRIPFKKYSKKLNQPAINGKKAINSFYYSFNLIGYGFKLIPIDAINWFNCSVEWMQREFPRRWKAYLHRKWALGHDATLCWNAARSSNCPLKTNMFVCIYTYICISLRIRRSCADHRHINGWKVTETTELAMHRQLKEFQATESSIQHSASPAPSAFCGQMVMAMYYVYATLSIQTSAAAPPSPFTYFFLVFFLFLGQPSNLPAAALRWIYFIARNETPTRESIGNELSSSKRRCFHTHKTKWNLIKWKYMFYSSK